MGGGAALSHLVLYSRLIAEVEQPTLTRWFLVASPLLVGALAVGARTHCVRDWLVASGAAGLWLQLYEQLAAQAGARPFAKSLVLEDASAYWGRPLATRLMAVASLLALAVGAAEGLRVLWSRLRAPRSETE